MAATDARPVPRKNTAYRLPLAIRKNDGTLITTWAGQDSEVSLDGAAFTDCTNEATEIGTSGCGYLDLTAGEMNADSVIVKITVTNTDALPIVVVLYPEEAGDMRSDVTHWKGSAAPDNTGDAYARLGAPAGASIAADIATVDTVADAIKAKTDNLPASPAATGAAMTLTAAYDAAKTAAQAGNAMALTSGERTTLAAAIEAAIINELDGAAVMQAIADLIASDMTTTDLTVAAIASACRDAILDRVLNGNHDTAGTPGKLLQNADVATSTRLATAGYTAPDNASITAIKAKTDNLPASPAAVGSAMTLTEAYDAAKTAAQAGSAMTLTTGERTSVADAILTRDLKSITTTVTYCLYTFVMAALKSAVSGTSWLIQKPSGAEYKTGTVTTDVNGNITGADLGDES